MAVIENGVVTNIIEASRGFAPEGMTLVKATKVAEIGGTWNGSRFTRPVEVAPVIEESPERRAIRALAAALGQTEAVDSYLGSKP